MFRVPERCKTNGLDFHSHEVDLDHSPVIRVSRNAVLLARWFTISWRTQRIGKKTQMKSLVVLLMDKILHHQGWWLSHYL